MGHDPHREVPPHARERVRLGLAESRIAAAKLTGACVSMREVVVAEGYSSPADFFDAELALPMSIESFIHFVEIFHLDPGLSDAGFVKLALRRLMNIAVETNKPFILGRTHLDPLAAARWIDSLPTERGLLPPELRDFLGKGEATAPPMLLLPPPSGSGKPAEAAPDEPNAPRIGERRLARFLKDTASKEMTKDDLFKCAEAEFGEGSSTIRGFNKAYQQLPEDQRRARGEHARTLEARGRG
jgi:hypothetical protein